MRSRNNNRRRYDDRDDNRQSQRNRSRNTGGYGIGENQGSQYYGERNNDSSDNGTRYRDGGDTYENYGYRNRGYQDMNNRSEYQDYNKNLDEDRMQHYGSESGFEEFDDYADEYEGNGGYDYDEYNVRYNDDRDEEDEDLHTDTDVSRDLSREEIAPSVMQNNRSRGTQSSAGKRRSTVIQQKYGPYGQTESEGDHHEMSPGRSSGSGSGYVSKRRGSRSSGRRR